MFALNRNTLKLGDAVAVVWKKTDGSACGGTEGVVLGILGDPISGRFLVIDRSTYEDSFKSELFLLNILDLRVVPLQDVDFIRKTTVRHRPPGISEKFTLSIEVNYKSNIDFNSTVVKVEKRSDCKHERHGNSLSETYQIGIEAMNDIERASLLISCEGVIQVFCKHEDLNRCISWIKEAVELLPEHKHLVLIPTKVTYKINATYKESSRPSEEVIHRIAATKGNQPIVFPIGWAHRYFVELDENPLKGLFPDGQSLENSVFEREKRKDGAVVVSPNSYNDDKSEQSIDLQFPRSCVDINRFLGAGAPVMQITGLIKSAEDEEGLMRIWLESRSDPWQWLDNGPIHGKVITRDLTIDRKTGTYSIDITKYSDSEFRD